MSPMKPLAGLGPLHESAKILPLHPNVLRKPHNLPNGSHDLFSDRLIRFCKRVFKTLQAHHEPNPTRMVLQRAGSEVETTPTSSEQIRPDEENLETLDLLSLRLGETLEELVNVSYASVKRVE